MMAGEVHLPEHNIPKALIFGTFFVLIIYGLINWSYFYALPFNEILSSSSKAFPGTPPVAAKAAQTFLGEQSLVLFSILLFISAIGAMNCSIMSESRVP
jgi:APA family basic amino acid/polyamine antiporter